MVMVILISRIPLLRLVKRCAWVWLAILALAGLRLFQQDGFDLFLATVLMGTEWLLVMMLLLSTTRFTDLLQVLSALGLPAGLISALNQLYVFIAVFADERNLMSRSRLSRSYSAERRRHWHISPGNISILFTRCADRAKRINGAMNSRGLQ